MAYNKDNYDNNRLTSKQEEFVYGIANGKTQYQAYIDAYPKAKKWKRESVDVAASQLLQNNKIIIRLEELNKIKKEKIAWTRDRALNEINYVLEMNKKDIERMNEGFQTEIDIKQKELLEYAKLLSVKNIDTQKVSMKIVEITNDIALLKQKRRTSGVNTAGILNAAKLLNRMYGYDITKVEVNPEDEERENMEKLSVEELKAIAYANINRSNTEES